MDRKIIDLAFGEINSSILLKRFAHCDLTGNHLEESPFLSGNSSEFGNLILINYKDVNHRLINGMQIVVNSNDQITKINSKQFSYKCSKIYDQSVNDSNNCFNFLSSCNVA